MTAAGPCWHSAGILMTFCWQSAGVFCWRASQFAMCSETGLSARRGSDSASSGARAHTQQTEAGKERAGKQQVEKKKHEDGAEKKRNREHGRAADRLRVAVRDRGQRLPDVALRLGLWQTAVLLRARGPWQDGAI